MKNCFGGISIITYTVLIILSINACELHTYNWSEWNDKPETIIDCIAIKEQERYCSCGEKETNIVEDSILGPHIYSENICTACCSIQMTEIPVGTISWGNAIMTISKPFKMAKYEVTQELYQIVMGNNPSYFNSNPTSGELQNKRPVEWISWYDTIEFCNKLSEREGFTLYYNINKTTNDQNNINEYDKTKWLITTNEMANGYRLPTEVQWEHACRADSTTTYYFGNDQNELLDHAWYIVNSNNMTHQVGKKLPNSYGLYDMYGNVWEYCWDWYINWTELVLLNSQSDYKGAVSGEYRVIRGSHYYNNHQWTDSSVRTSTSPFLTGETGIGFRVIRP